MTNFFEHQQSARARTYWLIALFILSAIAITALIYPVATLLFGHFDKTFFENEHDPLVLLGSFTGVWGVIGVGSLLKSSQLSEGGKSVALSLGGRQITGNSREARERRLLNIVEEMAIASGLPMPAVYVLDDEKAINAFAAGLTPGDAVVAVSRGCLQYLNRDELQGVVAHEFSHILNGDMRLNFRMIVLIAGLIGLAMMGRVLLESAGRGRSDSSSKDDGRNYAVMLGFGLLVIGGLGMFFGRIIQAAVSRQREYLADASAVQFTRNPEGIAGALKKIGAFSDRGKLKSPAAGEVAHLFFADGLARFSSLLATHPPLADRIRRIDPRWDGKYPPVRMVPDPVEAEHKRDRRGLPSLPGMPNVPLPVVLGLNAETAVERVGTVPADSTGYAIHLLRSLPAQLREAVGEPFQARAVIFGLLLDRNAEVRMRQLAALQSSAEPRLARIVEIFQDPLKQLPEILRLPLVDLCIPTLRQMSSEQHRDFRRLVDVMVQADQRMNVFEYVLQCVLERHLDQAYGWAREMGSMPPSRRQMEADATVVLAFLAWEGHDQESAARAAFAVAMSEYLRGATPPDLPERASCTVEALDLRLRRLAAASLQERRRLLLACTTEILADRQTNVRETELARAISDVLGLPMPPMLTPRSGHQA